MAGVATVRRESTEPSRDAFPDHAIVIAGST